MYTEYLLCLSLFKELFEDIDGDCTEGEQLDTPSNDGYMTRMSSGSIALLSTQYLLLLAFPPYLSGN